MADCWLALRQALECISSDKTQGTHGTAKLKEIFTLFAQHSNTMKVVADSPRIYWAKALFRLNFAWIRHAFKRAMPLADRAQSSPEVKHFSGL